MLSDTYQEILRLSESMAANARAQAWDDLQAQHATRQQLIQTIPSEPSALPPEDAAAFIRLIQTIQQMDQQTMEEILTWQEQVRPLIRALQRKKS